ncbi:hypothetical protein [Streptomyces sp. NBC_01198]|uniref:hypothetical protein n=1 Tax=Streptomyces sp. NBC_01198 TaxID=2903769 RepID=UPI002E10D956|nr:hypothetical protein OG702_00435 [Streptomyces sp. NBC_01198]
MSAFDDHMAMAAELLGTSVQIPDVTMNLTIALNEHHNDVDLAAADNALLRSWTGAADETRSAVLLSMAWTSRPLALAAPDVTAGRYAQAMHAYARGFSGGETEFVGPAFPRSPLPGKAGALASWIGFDRDDIAGLKAALILMASTRQRLSNWP